MLILRGVFAGRNENNYNIWAKSHFSRPIFTACMARYRFQELLRLIWSDDIFNKQLRRYLTPTECLTIDEMLVKFQGNARFRVYMKDKPGKYGLLFRVITDAVYHYVLNVSPYTGRPQSQQSEQQEAGQIKQTVKSLVEPWRGSGRNISCDRLYTDIDLAEELYNDANLTMASLIKL